MADQLDLDIYADDIEDSFPQEEFGGDGEDLYNDVITAPSSEAKDTNGRISPAAAIGSSQGIGERSLARGPSPAPSLNTSGGSITQPGKRVQLYIGNLTWWTTDQDLMDACSGVGVPDIIEIKFHENRANGQSKGFCAVIVNSEQSARMLIDRLPKKEIHGQQPAVTYTSKQALNQFESQAKTRPPRAPSPGSRPPPLSLSGGPSPGFAGPPLVAAGSMGGPPPRMLLPGGPDRLGLPPMGMQGGGNRPHGPGHGPQGHQGPPPGFQDPYGMGMPPQFSGPRGPPPGMNMRGPHMDARGPPPRPDWNRPPGFPHHGIPHHGPPGMPPRGPPPAPHVNPAFFPPNQGPPHQGPPGFPPPNNFEQFPPDMRHDGPALSEAEFEETMSRNRTVSSSAITRAVTDAATGDYSSAIETLVTAISLIKQSKVARDERCKVLVGSLEDTLHGIEAKSYSAKRSSGRSRSRDRESRHGSSRRHRSRSAERDLDRDRKRERERDTRFERDYRGRSAERPRERSRSHDRERDRDRDRERERETERDRNRDRERDYRERSREPRDERYYDDRYREKDRERVLERDRERERDHRERREPVIEPREREVRERDRDSREPRDRSDRGRRDDRDIHRARH